MGPMDWAGLVNSALSPKTVDDMECGRLCTALSWSMMSESGRLNR